MRFGADALDLTDACAVVATVGTTSSTAVDPVAAIADRAAAAGTWLHVDAAYAGAAAVCPELRHHFAGWERADSIGFNPHKWLFTPMDCSAFFCRRPDDLRRAFSLVPEYLRVNEDVVSLSEYASPLGRRFRALKLWATLRCFGREGLQAIIREHVRLAELFEQWVAAEPGWELCAPRPFSLVCFRWIGSDEENAAIMERVNDSGQIFLSHTKLDGRFVLRLAIGNARTSEADVALAWDVLREAAAAARPQARRRRRDRLGRSERLDELRHHLRVTADLRRARIAEDEQLVEHHGRAADHGVGVLGDSRHDGPGRHRRLLVADLEPDSRRRHVRGDRRPQRLLEPARRVLDVGWRRAERLQAPARERADHGGERCAGLGQLVHRRGGGRRKPSARDHAARLELPEPGGEHVRRAPGQPLVEIAVAQWAVLELAHEQQRPPLADEVERVGHRAVLVVGLHVIEE